MSLPNGSFPSASSRVQGMTGQEIDPIKDNVFQVMPLGDAFDQIVKGARTVTIELANYIDPDFEGDVQRVMYGHRDDVEPWTHSVDLEIDELAVDLGDGADSMLFAGAVAIGDVSSSAVGKAFRSQKYRTGWIALSDLVVVRADVPALKVLCGELPLAGSRRSYAPSADGLDHLRGTEEDVLANLRARYDVAGSTYNTPEGPRAF